MRQRPIRPENWKGVEDGLAHAKHLLKVKNLPEAEIVLRKILEFSPVEAKVWHLLGRIQQAQQLHHDAQLSFSSARQYYKQSKITQRATPTSIRLAKLLMKQGDAKSAKNMLRSMLEKEPSNQDAQQLYNTWQGEAV